MAHYAFLNEDNIVTEIIVGVDETETIEGQDPETWYGSFRGQSCKRTSFNGNIRGTFAGVGYFYNQEEDIFVMPQPFASWIRNGSIWEAPVPLPDIENKYQWNEETGSWNELP